MVVVYGYLVCCVCFTFYGISTASPDHGYQIYLGHDYWNNRKYDLSFPGDWPGFWNYGQDGRKEYKRATSEVSGRLCSGCGCSDKTEELQCTGSPASL